MERTTALDQALRTAEELLSGPVRGALDTVRGYRARSGSGYVVDTLWSAWEAFADSSSYEQTVERAIRYGNDTDTTACVAGGLAGVYWGLDGVPWQWRDQMRGQDIAGPLVARLVASEGST